MIRADLHVHSRYSAHPSEWFLQRLGTRESYTDIETIYTTAMQRGMQYVTITDHNCIDGVVELQRMHPENVFTGVEATTYFPEDGCKIHILIYGLSSEQFHVIESVRNDIYDLRDYIREQGLAHSVAHATFSINKKMSMDHFCRLVLLFDYFETTNGTRTRRSNEDLFTLLRNLTPDHLSRLRERYAIEPFGDEPWKKGLTGGSDDHSGLQIAQSFTSVPEAETVDDFLRQLIKKESSSHGMPNDYKRFAFSIYKIAFDFSKEKSSAIPASFIATLSNMVFYGKSPGIKNRLAITRMKLKGQSSGQSEFQSRLFTLINDIDQMKNESVDRKLDVVYDHLSSLCDELFRTMFTSAAESLAQGDLLRLFRSVAGLLPMTFLSLPFVSTIHILSESRLLQEQLDRRFGIPKKRRLRRVLWFTDTITDLNGPSETIRKCAWLGFHQDLDLIPVTSLLPDEKRDLLPPTVLDLAPIWTHTPEFFSSYTLRVPSLLGAVKTISAESPDEIIISTPGPVGLLGLLCARLLHLPCKGIYHTDFTEQFSFITGDETVCNLLEEYVRWFYCQCSEIKVPTREYIRILSHRGYPVNKMTLFPRGIEPDLFSPQENAREELEQRFGIPKNNINLLYVGRISAEKQVDLLLRIQQKLCMERNDINLIFAGNGPDPYYTDFKKLADNLPGVFFLGRLARNELPTVYSAADLMLFPSTTDTFGMVVLEAQACGLPVIVSDVGGPKEIIVDGKTGYVLPTGDVTAWADKIKSVISVMNTLPEQYFEMKHASRAHVLSCYDWQAVLNNLFGISNEEQMDDVSPTEPFTGHQTNADEPEHPPITATRELSADAA